MNTFGVNAFDNACHNVIAWVLIGFDGLNIVIDAKLLIIDVAFFVPEKVGDQVLASDSSIGDGGHYQRADFKLGQGDHLQVFDANFIDGVEVVEISLQGRVCQT